MKGGHAKSSYDYWQSKFFTLALIFTTTHESAVNQK
jgi:hypothetical protein